MLPIKGDRSWRIRIKAFTSVHQEKKVKSIMYTLKDYRQTLTYHQSTSTGGLDLKNNLHTTQSRSPGPEARKVFLLLFKRDYGYINRAGIVSDLEEKLK